METERERDRDALRAILPQRSRAGVRSQLSTRCDTIEPPKNAFAAVSCRGFFCAFNRPRGGLARATIGVKGTAVSLLASSKLKKTPSK